MSIQSMMAPVPNLRYERKFLAQGRSLSQVLAAVRHHPAMFREVYPPRWVNNIYFDSPALHAYFDHVNGVADRVKTRIRWYGQLNGHIERPTLERKLRRGLVGGKVAHALPPMSVNGGVSFPDLDRALGSAKLPEMMRSVLRHLRPCLINRYERRYFLSADGCFRLTADSELEFCGLLRAPQRMVSVFPRSSAVIIELKFDTHYAENAADLANALPFRLARCSKYVLGIHSVTGT